MATREYPEEMCHLYGLVLVLEVEQVTDDKSFSTKLTAFSIFSTSIYQLFYTNMGLETEEFIVLWSPDDCKKKYKFLFKGKQ